jgi:hypothetical protein
MKDSTLTCRDELRRQAVRQHRLNGLDYLEVSDDQRSLCVHFLGPVPTNLTKNNIKIDGGRRIRGIQVTGVEVEIPDQDDPTLDGCLRISVDKYGDFSTYTLAIVETDSTTGKTKLDDQGQRQIKVGFDQRYAHLPFSFKVGCPSELDCKSDATCSPAEHVEPDINYLAKDYGSFRQLILDRLALTMPEWRERHVPDLGITLVELLAYVGDYLSYYQDAVATEAYLDTARQRISVRRHVRLVDYTMHEGCNARTWVWIEVMQKTVLYPADFFLITTYRGAPSPGTVLNQATDFSNISANQYEVFEPVAHEPIHLNPAHSKIHFYTWGDHQCCLPKGTTQATIYKRWQREPQLILPPARSIDVGSDGTEDPLESSHEEPKVDLQIGDILIFEEVKGANTGNKADANPAHRHVVRLTKVEKNEDALYNDPIDNSPVRLLEIEWAIEDALPFSLCISALGAAPDCCLIENISVARGNVILVDHGRTITEELGTVSEKTTFSVCEAEGQSTDISIVPATFHPHLQEAPLTFSQPLLSKALSAAKLLEQDPRQALPQIIDLTGVPRASLVVNNQQFPNNQDWQWIPQSDLLSSYSQDRHFVVEMDDQGIAHLRFGDGELGKQPAAGTNFHAKYRIGNGTAGNIGANTISHLVFRQVSHSGDTLIPHNPFPAAGGIAPEPLAEVKLFATSAFRKKLQRAITAQDYADIVMRDFPLQVQRAAATLRWTGSWYEVLVAIDPRNSAEASGSLLQEIEQHLYLHRRIGHDVVVKLAIYVPLAIAMHICVLPNYLRGHVLADLPEVFSNRRLANGRLGFFHPDNLTFGTGIYLSKLIAAAQAVPGVMTVEIKRLKRLVDVAEPSKMPKIAAGKELLNGLLPLGALEIARLDNDPSFPENGVIKFDLGGGR